MSDHFKFVLDTSLCTACRACELACHYRHTGNFGTAFSRIHIRYDADSADVNVTFLAGCDQCAGEPGPLCARACVPQAIRMSN